MTKVLVVDSSFGKYWDFLEPRFPEVSCTMPTARMAPAILMAALVQRGRTIESGDALEQAPRFTGTTHTNLNWEMFYWPFQYLDIINRLADDLVRLGIRIPPNKNFRISNRDRLTSEQINSLLSNKVMRGADRI